MSPLLLAVVALVGDGPFTQPYAIDQAAPEGLWLSSDVGAGVVDGDVVVAPAVGIGFESKPVAVHLRLPVTLRAWDLPPLARPEPTGCAYIRCSEWLDEDDNLAPAALSRIVDDARLFQPGDVVYARAGGLLVTLGHGQLVSRYTNAAEWDRRRSGAFAELNLPWVRGQAQVFTASALQPLDLFGVRIAVNPLTQTMSDQPGALERFLDRARIGFEVASDPFAPRSPPPANVGLAGGLSPNTGPVIGAATDLTWPLLDEAGTVQLAPWIGGSGQSGLFGSEGWPAFGAAAGLDATVDIIAVALHLGARATLDMRGHRAGLFGTLYDIDRRRMIQTDDTFATYGAAELLAPGGLGTVLEADVLVLRAVKAETRLHIDPAPENNELEVGADVAAGSFLVGARVLERAFAAPINVLTWGPRTFAVLEGAWAFYPPFSCFVRFQHALRFHDDARGLAADDDFLVGLRFDLVLSSGA